MKPIVIRPNRFSYLIPLPFIALLVYLFFKHAIIGDTEEGGTIFFIIGLFVIAVGTFLFGYFSLQFFRNPAFFKADDHGFEYNPSGVNLGLIPWRDVSGFEEVQVKVVRGNVPAYETAFAVMLKDPEQYRKRFNKPLRFLMAASEKINKGTILIEPASLLGHYEEVKKMFEEKTKGTRDPWVPASTVIS